MTTTPRVIPCLLLRGDELVKTERFDSPRYVGDPVNVLNIFSHFEVDEIVLLDIGATPEGRGPRLDLLAHLAEECLIPLAYGGGIRSLDDARRILAAGFEKVVLNTALADRPGLASEIASTFGSQAVVASVDARAIAGGWEVVTAGGRRPVDQAPDRYAATLVGMGAGEILLTSVDRDGTMEGYDLALVRQVAGAVDVPVVACGGAGSRGDLAAAVGAGASAAAAGSLFVFQGKGRGVLINFPRRAQLEALFG